MCANGWDCIPARRQCIRFGRRATFFRESVDHVAWRGATERRLQSPALTGLVLAVCRDPTSTDSYYVALLRCIQRFNEASGQVTDIVEGYQAARTSSLLPGDNGRHLWFLEGESQRLRGIDLVDPKTGVWEMDQEAGHLCRSLIWDRSTPGDRSSGEKALYFVSDYPRAVSETIVVGFASIVRATLDSATSTQVVSWTVYPYTSTTSKKTPLPIHRPV